MTSLPSTTAFRLPVLVALLATGVFACRPKDQAQDSGGNGNACTGPVAAAGADQSVTPGTLVTLDGTASTVCDEASEVFLWSVESVPVDSAVDVGDLDLTDPAKPTFAPDVVGTYVFSLAVSDASGAVSSADLVVIDVTAGSAKPVADCGGNQSAEVGQRVTFDGSGSSDPEGAPLTYHWTLATIPECSALTDASIYNGAGAQASIVPDCASVFVVALAVSDGETWSDPSYCAVNVGSGNLPPVADAGSSGDLSPCTERDYELNGFGSYDPEGSTLTYQWTLLAKPDGSGASDANFSDRGLPNPTFSWDVTGEYTFELRVNDGTYDSPPDVVVLNFQDVSDNAVPIANAGSDQTITKETECETASYVWTCPDCAGDDVELDGTASDDPVDGDDLSFAWSDPSGQLTIANPNSAITTVYTPDVPGTYGTTTTRTWDLTLSVSDCADTATDTVRVTYNCTGTN